MIDYKLCSNQYCASIPFTQTYSLGMDRVYYFMLTFFYIDIFACHTCSQVCNLKVGTLFEPLNICKPKRRLHVKISCQIKASKPKTYIYQNFVYRWFQFFGVCQFCQFVAMWNWQTTENNDQSWTKSRCLIHKGITNYLSCVCYMCM